MSIFHALTILLVGYVPGALIFRLPIADRSRRASLAAEERLFWAVALSLALSSCVALGLAAAGRYGFQRLLWIDGAISALIVLAARGRLRLGPAAPHPTWTAAIPLGLVAAGLWINFFVPPAEWIMGGRDPGVYINEGIQIAQRGSLVLSDEVVRSVPPPYRGLFFTLGSDRSYYSTRFMGFFVLDPAKGTVVGQFPHLYPVWIAIAYGLDGLSGARWVVGFWAVLGLLAVYFAGVRIVGRAAAAAGAGLLAVSVVQVWYARYPNAEMLVQFFVFAAFVAYERAQREGDGFFAPVAALLLVLAAFAHLTGVLALLAAAGGAVLGLVLGERARSSFGLPLVIGLGLVTAYLATYNPPYYRVPAGFIATLEPAQLTAIGLAIITSAGLFFGAQRVPLAQRVRWVRVAAIAAIWALAAYAYFFRFAAGALAAHDADSVRTFTSFYLSPWGLVAALIGFAFVAWKLPVGSVFLVTVAACTVFVFHKIRIVPEHFWAARRFLPVVLPSSLLLAGAGVFYWLKAGDVQVGWARSRVQRAVFLVVGMVFVLLLGWHFFGATQPILRHVEYAGLIPRVEQLAATFGDRDLVIVESRGASDVHVLALPLAYVYARNVLVLASTAPDKQAFRDFLRWARDHYGRIFFMGGGGTELLSRTMSVAPLTGERFQVPEYETAVNAYPQSVRFKEFELGVYELLPGQAEASGFDLQVGSADDVYVRRFHAKERRPNGSSYRWTRDVSFVSIVGTRPENRELTVWMNNGGRPPSADPADVDLFLDDQPLGKVTVGTSREPYRFAIPPDLAAAIASSEDAAQLRIAARTWNPARLLRTGDDRDLGVMIDRIAVK